MKAVHIAFEDGWYRVYRTVNGKYRQYVGPRFDTPKAAAMYAERLEQMPETSPLPQGGGHGLLTE